MTSKFTPIAIEWHPRGTQLIYRFDNGYAASVIPDHYPDTRELAVLAWTPENQDDHLAWPFVSNTAVAPHSVIRLDVSNIDGTLEEISQFPPRSNT